MRKYSQTRVAQDGGVYHNGQEAAGFWKRRTTTTSINYAELMAVMCAIKSFKSSLKGKNVQILSDNVTMVAYLNHLGGASPELTQLMTAISLEAHESGITLVSKHFADVLNGHAAGYRKCKNGN